MKTHRWRSAWLFLVLSGFWILPGYGQSFSRGMAATAHPMATRAALDMLRQGGNAVDAAVAAAFAIGVVEPDGSGIGGGGGMVIYLNDLKESYYIDYYPKASEKGAEAGYAGRNDIRTGKSVCIPGTVAGLVMAQERFGSLDLPTVMAPAIRLAAEGFTVDGVLARILLDNIETLLSDETTTGIFTMEGFPYMEGDLIVQEELAATLETIARKGRKGFYEGPLAESMVRGLNERGGTQTLHDFASYEASLSEPLAGSYRGYTVLTACPPQSGLSLIEALNILENHHLEDHPHYSGSARSLHLMAETQRIVYTDRYQYLGDPGMVTIPLEGLLSKEYGTAMYRRINPARLDPAPYDALEPGDPYPFMEKSVVHSSAGRSAFEFSGSGLEREAFEFSATLLDREADRGATARLMAREADGGHTTHLSVIDGQGNCVSLTQTLGLFFGSGQTVNGVLFNSAMSNFTFRDTESPNIYADGKTPRSAIMPAILLKEDRPFLVFGSPGAARIISTMIGIVVNVVDYGMDAEGANRAPRFYCSNREEYLHLESGIDAGVISRLEEMGHILQVYQGTDLFFGGVQMILVDPETGLFSGSADSRRGGSAEGY